MNGTARVALLFMLSALALTAAEPVAAEEPPGESCEVIIIEPDGSYSFHPDCIPRILPRDPP